ncbi:PLP-dependent aminotransferase family protein [Paracoccus aeridis]|uniref:aminotransferase-like domain-containing protein n=1 Tax=Paracoccus aeridis TaxID=1966466 RepID=UPI00137615F8|nr:PLP-dependent aminotransferase family protein [Paracoccus aeridis]
MVRPEYLKHADRLADEIVSERLGPGHRLPPLRQFAFAEGIAFSTATRVYTELARRGLVSGEVGRGTFVRAAPHRPALSEPDRPEIIDLEFNSTVVARADADVLSNALKRLASDPAFAAASAAAGPGRTWFRSDLLAAHLSRPDWTIPPEHLLCAGGGRQAIAAAFAALGRPGAGVGLEAITYPMAKVAARRLGLSTVPLAVDDEGVLPDAVERAFNDAGIGMIYMQPTLHNPLGTTMTEARRRQIADVLVCKGIVAVEDGVYGFLAPDAPPPVAAFAPDNVILIDSFSKRGFSGASAGFLVAASINLRRRLSVSLRSGAWLPAPINLALLSAILEAGSLPEIEQRKRQGAKARQAVLRSELAGWDVRADARSCHAWLHLPPRWRSDLFCSAAMQAGVAVTPGANFAVQPGFAPDAVRLAFSAVGSDCLRVALGRLRTILLSRPGEWRQADPVP